MIRPRGQVNYQELGSQYFAGLWMRAMCLYMSATNYRIDAQHAGLKSGTKSVMCGPWRVNWLRNDLLYLGSSSFTVLIKTTLLRCANLTTPNGLVFRLVS